MSDPYFDRMLLTYQMKMADNLDFRYIVGLRDDLEYSTLKKEIDPSVYIIGITSSNIPSNWKEVVQQAEDKKLLFYKVGTSNTKPYPIYYDYKQGADKPPMEKSALFARLQSYAHTREGSLLTEYVGMGDTVFVVVACVREFAEETRGQLAHKYEQEVLGMIKDNFGHPVGNIQESPTKTNVFENSLSNAKRLQVQEERKNGIGTLAQFFAPQKG